MAESTISKVISKDTITRLLKDVKALRQNPLTENGIYYIHDDTDVLKGYAMIVGPKDTPYFGGYYFFSLEYPTDYPHMPPKVKFHTNGDNIRFNPNLYKCGKVCVSLLNTWRGEQWTSCQTISTVLLTLCILLCKDPLLNEPGVDKNHKDFEAYSRIIEYKNIEIACLHMINKKDTIFSIEFDAFYSHMKEYFEKNINAIMENLEKHKRLYVAPEKLMTGLYSMSTILDYNKLYNYFIETKIKLALDNQNNKENNNDNNK
jgi:ubiquitin-conjugating enzyme E2 Z